MNEILKTFFSLSVSGSVIALVLFGFKPFVKDKLNKTWQYYIWLIVIIRLLLPFSIETNIVGRLFSETDKIISARKEVLAPINDIPTFNPQSPQTNHNEITRQEKPSNYWSEIKSNLWLIWLGIAIMLLVRKVTSYHSFVRYIKAGLSEVSDNEISEIFKTACIELGLKKHLKVYTNPLAASAMLVGVYKPFVVIPDIEVGEIELHNIFIHELTHYKRLDIFYKWFMQLAVCLHWYNPLVYLMSHEINKNCELSCDEAIIRKLDDKGKRSYGDTLLASLKGNGNYGNTIISITLNEDAKLLKERLSAIMKFRKKSKLTVILSTFLAALIFSGSTIVGAYTRTNNFAPIINPPRISAYQFQLEDDKFLSGAWISYEGQGASNIALKFPSWYTKDMWDVQFIWGDYAVMPMYYDNLDSDNKIIVGVGHDTHYELKIGLPNKETLVIDLRELERNLKSNQSANRIQIPAENQSSVNHKNDYASDEADKRGIAIIDGSGTWSQEVDSLIPYMTQDSIEKIVSIYLERHLFPGITTPEGARRVASTIEVALKYMSEEAKQAAENRISAYYEDNSDLSESQMQSNSIPKYFTSGGIANTTQTANTYTFEGAIKANKFQFGNPFPANKNKQLTFKLDSIGYVSGEPMDEDESILRVLFGANDSGDYSTGFNFKSKNLGDISLKIPVYKTANYPIVILNYGDKEVKYSFTVTID